MIQRWVFQDLKMDATIKLRCVFNKFILKVRPCNKINWFFLGGRDILKRTHD